jgi:hypothetical protein
VRLFRFRTLPASRKTSFSCPLIRPCDSHFAVKSASSASNPKRSAQSRRASRSACLISAIIAGGSLAVSDPPVRRIFRAMPAAPLSARSRLASYACCKLGERRSGIGGAPSQNPIGRRILRQVDPMEPQRDTSLWNGSAGRQLTTADLPPPQLKLTCVYGHDS